MTSQRRPTILLLGNNTKFQILQKLPTDTEILPILGCAALEMSELAWEGFSQEENVISDRDLLTHKEKSLKNIEIACDAAQISTRQRHLLMQQLDHKLCVFVYLQLLWHRRNIKSILFNDFHKSISSENEYWENLSKPLIEKLFIESRSALTVFKCFASQVLAIISLVTFFCGHSKNVCIATGLKYGMHSFFKRNKNFDFLIPSDALSLREICHIVFKKTGTNIYVIPRFYYGRSRLKRRIIDLFYGTHARLGLSPSALKILSNTIASALIRDDSFSWFDHMVLKYAKVNQMVCHQLRWGSAVSYAHQIKMNNGNVFLVSHGSHGVGKNLSDDLMCAIARFCDGMLFSYFNTHSILQTPNAEKSFNLFNKNNRIIPIRAKPVLWGRNLNHGLESSNNFANFGELTVLYAGTAKTLNSRPVLYESDVNYLQNLRFFLSIAAELSITIILRHRDSWALPLQLIKNEFAETYQFLRFSENISLADDFRRSSLVVSHSSTVVEEALIARRPVMLFGGDTTFEVVESSDEIEGRSTCPWVTKATTDNLSNKLRDLVDRLKRGGAPEGRNSAEWGGKIDEWRLGV